MLTKHFEVQLRPESRDHSVLSDLKSNQRSLIAHQDTMTQLSRYIKEIRQTESRRQIDRLTDRLTDR